MFLLIFVTKANDDEGGIGLYHQHNQSMHVTDQVTATSLVTNIQHKTSVATFCPCQIA
jgi:hypothetical protein